MLEKSDRFAAEKEKIFQEELDFNSLSKRKYKGKLFNNVLNFCLKKG
jgi:hypothetical protein